MATLLASRAPAFLSLREHEPAIGLGWALLHDAHGLADKIGAAVAYGRHPLVVAPHLHRESTIAEFEQVAYFCRGEFGAVHPGTKRAADNPTASLGVPESRQRSGVDV